MNGQHERLPPNSNRTHSKAKQLRTVQNSWIGPFILGKIHLLTLPLHSRNLGVRSNFGQLPLQRFPCASSPMFSNVPTVHIHGGVFNMITNNQGSSTTQSYTFSASMPGLSPADRKCFWTAESKYRASMRCKSI